MLTWQRNGVGNRQALLESCCVGGEQVWWEMKGERKGKGREEKGCDERHMGGRCEKRRSSYDGKKKRVSSKFLFSFF
jgi:hypothetical protein